MANLAVAFDILARDKASATLNKVGDSAEKTGGKLSTAGKVAAGAFGGAALAGLGAFTAGLADGFKEAISYQKITDQVAQTIKATGGAAGVSVAGLKAYAGQLESLSGVDEEQILSSQNVLLTFTQIQDKVGKGNDIFHQASLAALNLSTTLGTDVAGAAVQVGKALNDPTKGITALSKAGVSFTAQQKEQIKTLQASGNVIGAQKIILGELNKEFGGAAAAAGKGFGGTIARLKDTVSDAFRDIATRALPALSKVADFLAQALPGAISFVSGAFGTLAKAAAPAFGAISSFLKTFTGNEASVATFGDVISQVGGAFKLFGQVIGGNQQAFETLVQGDFGQFGEILAGIGTAVRKVVSVFRDDLIPALRNTAKALTPFVIVAIKAVGVGVAALVVAFAGVAKVLVPLTGFLRDHKTIAGALAVVVISLVAAFKIYKTYLAAVALATKAYAAVQAELNIVLDANPIGVIIVALAALAAGIIYAYTHSETFRKVVKTALDAVKTAAEFVFNFFKDHWPLLLGILTGPFGLAIGLIIQNFDAVKRVAKTVLRFVADKFLDFAGTAIHAAAAAFGWVPGIGPKLKSAAREFDKFAARVRASLSDIHPPPIVLQVKLAGPLGTAAQAALTAKLDRLDKPDLRRAIGGRVSAGTAYTVGEFGPETFVPNVSGAILNRDQARRALGGAGGTTFNLTVNNPVAEPASDSVGALRRVGFLLGA
ncbi:MAG: hypothetical protein ACXV5Q_00670 [Frankiaceae bacterium]